MVYLLKMVDLSMAMLVITRWYSNLLACDWHGFGIWWKYTGSYGLELVQINHIYHHRNLLFFRAFASEPLFLFFHQPTNGNLGHLWIEVFSATGTHIGARVGSCWTHLEKKYSCDSSGYSHTLVIISLFFDCEYWFF